MTNTTESGFLAQHGATLIENGYTIVPIPKGDKAPGIKGWEQATSTQAALDKWLRTGQRQSGVGIVTKNNPAVDIDVLSDPELVTELIDWIKDNIGDGIQRIGKAPKSLLLFTCDKPFDKVLSARYFDPEHPELDPGKKPKGQRVEIMGNGQQIVAYHIHPDTKKPYTWPVDGENPLVVPSMDLPALSVEQARAICREFERLAEARGWEKIGGGNAERAGGAKPADYDPLTENDPPDEDEDEIARVKAALDAISGEVASGYDYDQWVNVLFALKWTRWKCAEDLAREWSESSDSHDPKIFRKVWKGAQKRDRAREVTLGTLIQYAKDSGWDASRAPDAEEIAEDEAETLQALLDEVEFLQKGDTKALAAVVKMIAESDLPTSSIGSVLAEIKKITDIPIADLRADLKQARRRYGIDEKTTHAGYAKSILAVLEEKSDAPPVAMEGQIFEFDTSTGIWKGRQVNNFAVVVAGKFDGQENCERRSDYVAIANHAYDISAQDNEDFFDDAPIGLACDGKRFYTVDDAGAIKRETLTAEHKQKILVSIKPEVGPMPMFEQFLHETFEGEGEKEQIDLLQEVLGATVLGIMYQYEKAVLFMGKSRAGKGTLLKIIAKLMPKEAITAVSPFQWDNEYYLANLALSRINIVGELPEDMAIPAAHFKTVTGRDVITGRHPSGRPFSFTNKAAHIFNSNHHIHTRDHSEAFYFRWIMLGFYNSRLDDEDEAFDKDIDTHLAQNIVDSELPAILAWCMKGAKRLLKRGEFKTTVVSERILREWQPRTNSVLEFLLDRDIVSLGDPDNLQVKRADFYQHYTQWCKDSSRRPMGKHKVYDIIRSVQARRLGVKPGTLHSGVDVIRGLRFNVFDSFEYDDVSDDDEL